MSTPMFEVEEELLVDGPCYKDNMGNHAGFEVVRKNPTNTFSVINSAHFQPCSAQLAELKALTAACQEGTGRAVNIYTDSAYAHGVCHLFGAVWKMRGFKKADSTPIQHRDQIVEKKKLMSALLLPKQVLIIKCQAHKKNNGSITKGNNATDEAAKVAADSSVEVQAVLTLHVAAPNEEDIARMQEKAGVYEQNMWLKRDAVRTQQVCGGPMMDCWWHRQRY